MISLIWAMDKNRLIGNSDKLPWHYKEDLMFFKAKTKGKTVLMGDLTYKSLKGYYKDRPLPFGKIYVANKNLVEYIDASLITDVVKFLEDIKEDIFVIGGKTIYELAIPFSDYLYITEIDFVHEGDIYIKEFSLDEFRIVEENVSGILTFKTYERKKV